jgi:hypothetical protein
LEYTENTTLNKAVKSQSAGCNSDPGERGIYSEDFMCSFGSVVLYHLKKNSRQSSGGIRCGIANIPTFADDQGRTRLSPTLVCDSSHF